MAKYKETNDVSGATRVRNSYVGTSNHVNASFIASKPSVGKTKTSLNEESLRNALGAMNNEVNRKTGTDHVQTASQMQVSSVLRTVSSINYYNSNHITTSDSSTPKILKQKSLSNDFKNDPIKAISQVSRLSSSDDLGTASVGGLAITTVAGITGFKAAQGVADVGIKTAAATGDFAVKSVKTVGDFAQTMRAGANVTRLDGSAYEILKLHANETGLAQTAIAHNILNAKKVVDFGVNGVKTVAKGTIKTGQALFYAGKVTRNVFAGAYTSKQIVHAVGKGASALAYGAARLGRNGIKTALSGVRWTFVKAFPKTFKFLGKGSIGTWRFGAKALRSSGDLGLEAVGTTMEAAYQAANVADKAVKVTVKTAQVGGKTIVHVGKGAYRAGAGVYKGIKFIKNNGLKAAWKKARQKAGKAAAKGVKGVANLLLEAIKKLGSKFVVPLVVILALVIGVNVIIAPIMGVFSVFGGIFNKKDTGEEVNIDKYLQDASKGIPAKTSAYKNVIVTKLKDAEGTYDIVRFRANTSEQAGGLVTDHTYEAVSSVFPSDDEVIEMAKPLFQAVILMKYENSPSEAEAQELLDHIIDKMFSVVQADTTEYCGQDIKTGEGEVDICGSCGAIHAHDDCPNPKPMEYHDSYTCDKCCYHYCPGHSEFDQASGLNYTSYCDGCEDACNGHIDCGEHKVTTFTLNCDGIYGLVQEYFTDPIDDLESISPRSVEEDQQLSLLKSYYEIFEQMAKMTGIGGYSGGLSLVDLSNVQWVNGSRPGCTEIVEYAKQYVGNIGGQPFWSYLGFEERVAWCACYVYYVMQNSGYGGSYPASSNYAYCQTMANAFSSEGRFADRSFTEIAPGDVIYFDWGCDGHTDHTGIVIGRDDKKVYTVEGNSGDKCKIKSYNLDSRVIYGYGLMNY